VELEQNLDAFRKHGLGVAAISYDSVAVLKNFADRQHISYPLLSDPESKIIRAFDILNETVESGTVFYGIPYPGTFILDTQGRVIAKYFEEDYRERVSASDILVRQLGKSVDVQSNVVETKHLRLATTSSTPTARPGHRIVLSLEIDLKPKMHVYSPGVQGYIPIEWKLEAGTLAKLHAFEYPPSQQMRLKAISETVPVYQGHVRINREITFGPENAVKPLVSSAGLLILKGSLQYQACDDKECFIPQTVPLEWRFHFEGLDRERAPADLQRKPQ
jgi:AhpC/TSA family/Thiol:disulfide interchange protein DsbD, N-terminal